MTSKTRVLVAFGLCAVFGETAASAQLGVAGPIDLLLDAAEALSGEWKEQIIEGFAYGLFGLCAFFQLLGIGRLYIEGGESFKPYRTLSGWVNTGIVWSGLVLLLVLWDQTGGFIIASFTQLGTNLGVEGVSFPRMLAVSVSLMIKFIEDQTFLGLFSPEVMFLALSAFAMWLSMVFLHFAQLLVHFQITLALTFGSIPVALGAWHRTAGSADAYFKYCVFIGFQYLCTQFLFGFSDELFTSINEELSNATFDTLTIILSQNAAVASCSFALLVLIVPALVAAPLSMGFSLGVKDAMSLKQGG